ncbi:icarapin-like [Leptopilina boulardi]|uniref:icarapin-like n=1 Tax=Leptopilina boulardi TaxID=63433 RepID=UPI0021F51A35|nr:icarapin-like [Leptopilina boulardi]
MKYFGALFVSCLFFALVHSAPRVAPDSEEFNDKNDKKNTDIVLITPGGRRVETFGSPFEMFPRENIDTTQDDYFDFGIFQSLREMFQRRLQEIFRSQVDGFKPLADIPKGSNSTSTTKVINGHVVTVNDTTYSDGDENSGSVFRFRVVEIKPQNDTLDNGGNGSLEPITSSPSSSNAPKKTENTTPDRSVETVEDLDDNVIPKAEVEII